MKGKKLLFAGCLSLLAFVAFTCANADDAVDAARAATRRNAATTVSRQQYETNAEQKTNSISGISRSTNLSSSGTNDNQRDRSATMSGRNNVVVSRENVTSTPSSETTNVSARTTSNVMTRTTPNSSTKTPTVSRTAVSRDTATAISRTLTNSARTGTSQPTNARSAVVTNVSHTPTVSRSAINTSSSSVSRAATMNNSARLTRAGTLTAEEIINRDYTTCREVYYSCMDEFCANKDSQLKRCACSSRVNEFDSVKEQLAQVEDKLLDFNQRLLTVNMDKEDAEAIFKATEGELAFQQEDSTDSKKLLDEISKKLNSTFSTDSFDANLAPISLSLNVDAAFDSVDSLAGASTTAKTGTELYRAALPVCREMALEICSQDELDIVESGYQMAIEQDCNTVAKAYETQQDLAREKIREGSALLDISRLDIYQERNSDNILTCKKKMLDMLTNTSVCGTDLQKCLDISGQYIDPSTGEAILTSNLVNLGNLITRPEANQTWTKAPGNEKFVSYLNSKKMFLESATENCQDIADYVWDEFIEDALAQIKLAQENKLEEVRQSCTTLTTQCLTEGAESLEDFDARALSIFGVEADKTVKQMCSEVQTACTALLDTVDGGEEWNTGMTEIATDKTYETIMQTCREVGRACIIQSCKSISGNFGLCENIQTSVNRKAIINRTACWDEVLECVASAGIESINGITELQKPYIDEPNGAFYNELYGTYNIEDITNIELEAGVTSDTSCITSNNRNCIYDICASECGFNATTQSYAKKNSDECQVCRLAEKVWGNCETHPAVNLQAENSHNQIKIPDDNQETLLSWFAKNTNTEDALDSCRDTSCGPGFISNWDETTQSSVCVPRSSMSDDGEICPVNTFWRTNIGGFNNCCKTSGGVRGAVDTFGNCCLLGKTTSKNVTGLMWQATSGYWDTTRSTELPYINTSIEGTLPDTTNYGLCIPDTAKFVAAVKIPSNDSYYDGSIGFLFCDGAKGVDTNSIEETFPSGKKLTCNGNYIFVIKSADGMNAKYISPHYTKNTSGDSQNFEDFSPVTNIFYREKKEVGGSCTRKYSSSWTWIKNTTSENCSLQTPANWLISYTGGE